MSPDEARRFLMNHLDQKSGDSLEVGNGKVLSARLNSTRLVITTTAGDVTLPFSEYDPSRCRVRPRSIYRLGWLSYGSQYITWLPHDDGIGYGLCAAMAALKQEQASLFSDDDEQSFAAAVKQYQEASPKPAFGEDAIRFKVQAEGAVKDKDFADAARLFKSALNIAPWWPEGHFNLALVLAETGDYALAMREMKRYLLLAPDAANARAAQNKIYEWERKAPRQP